MQYGQCPSKKRKLGHRNTERRHMWRHREETYVETQRGDVRGDTERRRMWRQRGDVCGDTERRRVWRHREKTAVYKPQGEASEETDSADTVISDF